MCYENMITLQWRHNGVSNHQPHDCLLNRLFGHRSKKTSKLRVTGLRNGNSSVTGEFPRQRASNAENVSIRWCHHEEEPLPVRGTFECGVKVGSKILMPSSVSLRGVVYLYLWRHNVFAMNVILIGYDVPDSKVNVTNMGPTWVLLAPGGPHVCPMNFAISSLFY